MELTVKVSEEDLKTMAFNRIKHQFNIEGFNINQLKRETNDKGQICFYANVNIVTKTKE